MPTFILNLLSDLTHQEGRIAILQVLFSGGKNYIWTENKIAYLHHQKSSPNFATVRGVTRF